MALTNEALTKPLKPVPRNEIEAIVLLREVDSARAELQSWIRANTANNSRTVDRLLEAGFVPQPGSLSCRFFGYYRATDTNGAALTASVALCRNSQSPMVLVLDMLPPDPNRGKGAIIVKPKAIQ